MNSARPIVIVLWILPLILQATIASAMYRRKLVKSFPFFFSYTLVVLSTGVVLMFLPYPHHVYAMVYWYSEALSVVLSLAVIFEILGHILPSSPSFKFVQNSFWIVCGIAATAALIILIQTNAEGADRAYEYIILAERSVRFLQACLLIAVIALISRLGLTWRHHSVGIAAGFGVYSALALAILELRAHLHLISDGTYVLLNSAAYNVAVIIWAFYILRPRKGMQIEHLPKLNLAEWNNTVSTYITQWYRRF